MRKVFPISVIIGLTAGLVAQFVWKMMYFPEPLFPVILELMFIFCLAGIAIWIIVKK